MSKKPEWKIREEAANLVNSSPAVDGKYKWKCDQCGAEWEEPTEWTDFVNAKGNLVVRNELPNWGVQCEECSKKHAEELKEKLK